MNSARSEPDTCIRILWRLSCDRRCNVRGSPWYSLARDRLGLALDLFRRAHYWRGFALRRIRFCGRRTRWCCTSSLRLERLDLIEREPVCGSVHTRISYLCCRSAWYNPVPGAEEDARQSCC